MEYTTVKKKSGESHLENYGIVNGYMNPLLEIRGDWRI